MQIARLEFRPYRRRFRAPLQTAHGTWQTREGILLKLRDDQGNIGWGEIAPLSWFGSETLAAAIAFLNTLLPALDEAMIFSVPETLPACQFGLESAWEWLFSDLLTPANLPQSGLLPTGEAALHTWESLWHQGYRTFKWKIGVAEISQELRILAQLLREFPADVHLRLDANGGLSPHQAEYWLQVCQGIPGIEYLEQPLPPPQFPLLLQLAQHYNTPLALDESVATLPQLKACYHQGWRGIVVIKPAIAGSPRRLRQFCQDHPIDAVFSSVFETCVGRTAGLHLAAALGNPLRAMGYGTTHWFEMEPETPEILWRSPEN